MLEKDTNSGLNRLSRSGAERRHRQPLPAGPARPAGLQRPVLVPLRRRPEEHALRRQRLHRPAGRHRRRAASTRSTPTTSGWTGDGHLGRLNITHAFYWVLGRGRPPADRPAQDRHQRPDGRDRAVGGHRLAAAEGRRSSGRRATTTRATATRRGSTRSSTTPTSPAARFSYYVRQGIGLTGARVLLKGRSSIVPSLKSSKEQGQSNFVNPGLLLFNVGLDAS